MLLPHLLTHIFLTPAPISESLTTITPFNLTTFAMMNLILCVLTLVLRASGSAYAPVVITVTDFVTATCLAGQSPPPSSLGDPPAAPSPVSSASNYAPSPPPFTPPASGVTSDLSLLCLGGDTGTHVAAVNVDKLPMPHGSDRLADVATYNALPTLAASICQAPNHFHKIKTTPGQGSVKDSCSYEVYIDSVGCGHGENLQLIPAGGLWNEPLRSCRHGGVVYKVTKSNDSSKPVQFEINLFPDGSIYYDISFLDCMLPNSTNLSACPGWGGGVQCIPGRQGCQVFICGAGEYCDGSAYTVPEFGLYNGPNRDTAGAPVSLCKTEAEGIAFELCATD